MVLFLYKTIRPIGRMVLFYHRRIVRLVEGYFLMDLISNQKIEINKLDLFIFKDNRNYPLKILFKFIRLHKKIKDTN